MYLGPMLIANDQAWNWKSPFDQCVSSISRSLQQLGKCLEKFRVIKDTTILSNQNVPNILSYMHLKKDQTNLVIRDILVSRLAPLGNGCTMEYYNGEVRVE